MSDFWKGWLNIWSWGVILFGAGLAGFAFDATDGFARFYLSLVGEPAADDPGRHLRFAMGLMGCITIGWAITFMAAFRAAYQLSGDASARVWRMLTMAGLAWFVSDSLISILRGFPANALLNLLFLALYLVPVWKSGVMKV